MKARDREPVPQKGFLTRPIHLIDLRHTRQHPERAFLLREEIVDLTLVHDRIVMQLIVHQRPGMRPVGVVRDQQQHQHQEDGQRHNAQQQAVDKRYFR